MRRGSRDWPRRLANESGICIQEGEVNAYKTARNHGVNFLSQRLLGDSIIHCIIILVVTAPPFR